MNGVLLLYRAIRCCPRALSHARVESSDKSDVRPSQQTRSTEDDVVRATRLRRSCDVLYRFESFKIKFTDRFTRIYCNIYQLTNARARSHNRRRRRRSDRSSTRCIASVSVRVRPFRLPVTLAKGMYRTAFDGFSRT